jgi:hypothetical protein
MLRHREAWAEPQTAPTREAVERAQHAEHAPHTPSRTPAVGAGTAGSAYEVLIVVSKLKQYIKQQAAMHTAATVLGCSRITCDTSAIKPLPTRPRRDARR